MTLHHDHEPRFTTAALDGAPMDDELCLFVHTLVSDGRDVSPEVFARARDWARSHPSAAAAVAELDLLGAALEGEREPSAGFTDAVLAARRGAPAPVDELAAARAERGSGDLFRSLRRLCAAAALAIVVTVGHGVLRPAALFADDDPAALEVRQEHVADEFVDPSGRASPEAFEAGLDALIEADPRLSDDERTRLEERR